MPQHRSGLKSLRTTYRSLGCEPLENRALLTALIASAEIDTRSEAQFTAQARTFVETAIDHVEATQHQTPVNSSIESLDAVAEDGRPIRVTNYTVEMADSLVREVNLSSDVGRFGGANPVGAASAAAHISVSPMRSSLVFSFVIFPDSSVSVRARWNAPLQWSGFAASTNELPGTHGRGASSLGVSDQRQRETEPAADLPPSHGLSESQSGDVVASLAGLTERSQEHERTHSSPPGKSEDVHGEILEELSGEWCVIDFVDSESAHTKDAHSKDKDPTEPQRAQQTSTAQMVTEHVVQGEGAALALGGTLRAPSGMIALEFQLTTGVHMEYTQSDVSASAIYQIFVHADEASQGEAVVAERGNAQATSNPMELSFAEPMDPPQWSNQTLAWIAVAGGVVWTLRPQRAQPLDVEGRRG